MSPRDLSPALLRERLSELRLLLDDLQRQAEVTAESLAGDRDRRHVVEHVLVQVVQQAVAVNSHVAGAVLRRAVPDYRASFLLAAEAGLIDAALAEQLAGSVGLRNVLVHEYVDVDLAVVAAAVPLVRELYGRYLQQAAAWVGQRT